MGNHATETAARPLRPGIECAVSRTVSGEPPVVRLGRRARFYKAIRFETLRTMDLSENRAKLLSQAPTAIESSFAIVSCESSSAAALRFSRRCLTEDVPGIRRIFGAR
jgi:hypothetical protein